LELLEEGVGGVVLRKGRDVGRCRDRGEMVVTFWKLIRREEELCDIEESDVVAMIRHKVDSG